MKFKVIIYCALFCCSKFVASIPIDEEVVRQRARPPSNWQANQNTAEYLHGPGFAQTHNLHPLTNNHEYNANQVGQRLDNYGFNNSPIRQQALPKIERQTKFAEDANKPVGLLPQEDFKLVGSVNQLIKVNNERQNKQNRQAQNNFVNTASSVSTGVVPGRELSPIVREMHYNPGHINKNGWPVNRQDFYPEIPPAIVRGAYYHPSQTPNRVTYSQGRGSEFGIYNRPVRYENYNKAHAATLNANQPKFANTGRVENLSPYPGPGNFKRYEEYNHFPSNIPRNRLSQPAPSNINAPSSYTARITSSDTLLNNQDYLQNPVINSETNNQVPNTFETPIELSNIKSDNIGIPNNSTPKTDYVYEDGHVLVSEPNHDLPNQDTAAMVPKITELNKPDNMKFREVPVNDFGSANQPSETNYNTYVPTVQPIASNIEKNLALNPLHIDGFREERPISSDTSLQPKQRNITNLNIRNEVNNLLTQNHNHFTIIHPNGTVQNIDDLERLNLNSTKHILSKKEDHSRVDNNKFRSPLTNLPTNKSHVLDNGESIQGFVESLTKQTRSNGELQSSNLYNPLPQTPNTYENPLPQPPNNSDDEYYPPPQHPSDNYYNPPSRPLTENHYNPLVQPPISYDNIESSAMKSNKDYDGVSVPQLATTKNYHSPMNDYNYYPYNPPTHDNIKSISNLHTHILPHGIPTTTTVAPNDETLPKHLNSHLIYSENSSPVRTIDDFPNENKENQANDSMWDYESTLQTSSGTMTDTLQHSTSTRIDSNSHDKDKALRLYPYQIYKLRRSLSSTTLPTTTTKDGLIEESIASLAESTEDDSAISSDHDGSASSSDLSTSNEMATDMVREESAAIPIDIETPDWGEEDTTDTVSTPPTNSDDIKPSSVVNNDDGELQSIPDKEYDNNEELTTVKDYQNSDDSDTNESDSTIIDKLLKMYNATLNIYLIHVESAQPILERNKASTTFANGTVIQELTETTWQSKNDTEPTVVTMKKVYHDHGDKTDSFINL